MGCSLVRSGSRFDPKPHLNVGFVGPFSPPFFPLGVAAVNSEVRQLHEDLFDSRCFVVTQAVELPFVENERCGLCPSPPSGLARPD